MSSDEIDNKDIGDKESDLKENGVKEEDEATSKQVGKKKGGDAPKIKQPAKKRVKTDQTENKKPEKKVAKKVDEEVDADESDGDGEEEEEAGEKAVPLLDQPLEVCGSRKRKEVVRFIPVSQNEESKEVRVPEGKGEPLGDIAWIDAQIQRAKPEDLKLLHRLCFGKPGKAAMVKKTLKKFNGFEFEEASDEYEKKKVAVEASFKKVTVGHLKNLCNILDVEKGGPKSEIIDRILSFLTKPVNSGKKFPGSSRSKRTGAAAKNYDEGEETFQSRKKGKGKKKEEVTSDANSEEIDEKVSDNKTESEDDTKEEKKDDPHSTEESEEEAPAAKRAKAKKGVKKGKKAETTEKKPPPKKRAAAKKEDSDKEDGDSEAESEEEEDKPLAKKSKVPPTDEEIKTYVKSLLDGANLEKITMKKVCHQVYEHYPDFDLGQKKDFIKTTVKSLISS